MTPSALLAAQVASLTNNVSVPERKKKLPISVMGRSRRRDVCFNTMDETNGCHHNTMISKFPRPQTISVTQNFFFAMTVLIPA